MSAPPCRTRSGRNGERVQDGVAVVDRHGVDVGPQHLVVEPRARSFGAEQRAAAPAGRAHARPGRRRRSRPSWPSAPVTRIRTAQVPPVPQAPSATGARARSGSHQSRWSAYQATVSASPCSHSTEGAQPSSRAQLGGVEHVAAVVPGPVGHDRLERIGLAQGGEDPVGHLHDRGLDAAADVVRLADPAPREHGVDGRAVVEHVQPLPAVLGAGVERERLVVEGQRAEVRDQLLGELVGAVVVGAVGDGDRQPVRLGVGPHGVVRPRLASVVGRPGPVRRVLGEDLVGVEGQVPVDLARRHVVEARDAGLAGRLEHGLGPEHVGAEEEARVQHRQGVVRLGREVHDRVDGLAPQRLLGGLGSQTSPWTKTIRSSMSDRLGRLPA